MKNKQIKKLKKSIFADIAKYLQENINREIKKKHLNEGAWGYQPLENDSVLDIRDKLIKENNEKFLKEIKRLVKGSSNDAWYAIGLCQFLIDLHIKMDIQWALEKDEIFEVYEIALRKVDDETWFNTWANPEEIRDSVIQQKEELKRYRRIFKSILSNNNY